MSWSVVYKRAVEADGTLLFPERLSLEFLESQRRTMGSYLYANQYLNEVIPEDAKSFKKEWLRPFTSLPRDTYRFAFIDPAIGQKDHHDFTAVTVVHVDHMGNWYLIMAQRYRLNPTQIIDKMFELHDHFNLQGMGVEVVAYQEALLYLLDQEMKKRKRVIPVKGIKRGQQSKISRILGLVPRFEWGRLFISPGMLDFEDEYASFPRGVHDDILDSLASLEELVFYPDKKEITIAQPHSPNDPNYERWYIHQLSKRKATEEHDDN